MEAEVNMCRYRYIIVCVDISRCRYLEYLPEVIRVLMILVTLVLQIRSTHAVVVVVDDVVVVSLFTLSLEMISRIYVSQIRNVLVSCHNQQLL